MVHDYGPRTPRSPLVSLVVNVVRNVLDVIGAEALAEGGHGALAVGDLGLDGINVVTTGEVLLKRFLPELLLGHHAVVAARVAGRTVAEEDALAVLEVGRQGWTAPDGGRQQPQCDPQRQRAPRTLGGGLRRRAGGLQRRSGGA